MGDIWAICVRKLSIKRAKQHTGIKQACRQIKRVINTAALHKKKGRLGTQGPPSDLSDPDVHNSWAKSFNQSGNLLVVGM